MRVTQLGSAASQAMALNAAAARVQESSEQLSSGKRIRTVADAPTDAATVLRYNAHQAALGAQKKAAEDAQSWLSSTDTALQSSSAAVMSAMTTVQAGGSPAMDPAARNALADQLDAISGHLYELANSTAQGRSLFGGFSDVAFAKAADGTVTFTGDSGTVNRQVGATQVVQVNTNGADAFGFASGDDVFTVLREAAAALRSGDSATVAASRARLEVSHDRILSSLEKVGNTGASVESALATVSAQGLTLATAKSALVDTDLPRAVMDSQLATVGYQAALAAIAKADLPTLADYLR